VDWLDLYQVQEQAWRNRLEALLRRHWPEATDVLGLRSVTLLRVLAEYGGPQGLAADARAAEKLKEWGGRWLSETTIAALLVGARATVGVPMGRAEREQLQAYAREARRCRREQAAAKLKLRRLAKGHAGLTALAGAVGVLTACVLWVDVGDPREFTSGAAYRKAMGLNLKVRSSGNYLGKLKITKRGSSRVRRWLYFAALRLCQREPVKTWYEAKKLKDGGKGGQALIAIMRKLALALYQVSVLGTTFDAARLFPGRPLPSVNRAVPSPSAQAVR
jgi:transposase